MDKRLSDEEWRKTVENEIRQMKRTVVFVLIAIVVIQLVSLVITALL